MNSFGQYKRWVVILILLMMGVQAFSSEAVYAANPVIRDQEQVNCFGNVWVNHDNPRYQTFTPAITGHLSKVDIQIFDYYGATGAFQLSIFKEGDLSTPLAQAQLPPTNVGWVSFDFTGVEPYLKKNTMYRMVAASELGGSAGYGWYLSQSDVYGGGYSPAIGRDFCFATYMMPDYSISPAESEVTTAHSSVVANGTSQTTVTVKLKDAQGHALTSGGATVSIESTLGTVGPVTDKQDGTYTATLTSPNTLGTATISARVGGVEIAQKRTVQFVAGAPSATTSTLAVSSSTLPADGSSQSSVTVKL
ncbi:Ig-like domain-containing protein, partial [Paenibacillus taiwanensis]|uniref:Ig-like domain-containing protein n=1 Tax=Paenibacillus taiwanensis TaxID=401638 RepID=UPI00056A0EC1